MVEDEVVRDEVPEVRVAGLSIRGAHALARPARAELSVQARGAALGLGEGTVVTVTDPVHPKEFALTVKLASED